MFPIKDKTVLIREESVNSTGGGQLDVTDIEPTVLSGTPTTAPSRTVTSLPTDILAPRLNALKQAASSAVAHVGNSASSNIKAFSGAASGNTNNNSSSSSSLEYRPEPLVDDDSFDNGFDNVGSGLSSSTSGGTPTECLRKPLEDNPDLEPIGGLAGKKAKGGACVRFENGGEKDLTGETQHRVTFAPGPMDGSSTTQLASGGKYNNWRNAPNSMVTYMSAKSDAISQTVGIKVFVAAISVLIGVHGCLSTGYMTSVISTIEKRFEIHSSIAGFIVSSYEFGSLLSVLFVSYLGSQRHIPRWIGCATFLLAIGACIFSLPHFVGPAYQVDPDESVPDRLSSVFNFGSTKSETTSSINSTSKLALSLCGGGVPSQDGVSSSKCDSPSKAGDLIYLFVIAQVLLGVGGSPMFTLGTAYIDDHVSREDSSIYLAFMYVASAFGPVCGFLLGALTLKQYVSADIPSGLQPVGKTQQGIVDCGGRWND